MAKEPTLLTLPESEIASLLDIELLEQHINNKLIKRQLHPKLPLAILNYTNKATFDQHWDSITMRCRGLIYNYETGQIVAVPFRKFFNYDTQDREETWPENLPTTEPEITKKMDGSLGIMWRWKGRWGVATRGSFDSLQAKWAEDWINLNADVDQLLCSKHTPLFEIIYPDNQIVVKYPFKGCILIGCVENDTGRELTHSELKKLGESGKVPVVEGTDQSIDDLQNVDTENEEGYVATWHNEEGPPLKVKIKFATYFRLHRLLTGTSPKRIWEILKEGSSLSELIDNVPIHFKDWAEGWAKKLNVEYEKIEFAAKNIFQLVGQKPDRKAYAEAFLAPGNRCYSSILFKLLDGQSYSDVIWKMVKPLSEHQSTFRKVDE